MATSIPGSALCAGDVLLYRGTGMISRAIQKLDGTDVSHAGLYLGNGEVGEALADLGSLACNPLAQSVRGS